MLFDRFLLSELLTIEVQGLAIFFHLVFVIALYRKDYSVIDIAWGLGFVVVSALALTLNRSPDTRSLVVFGLIAIWGFRLGGFLLIRNLKKGTEDPRYASMRAQWGRWTNVHAYFKIFLTQPLILLFISFPTSLTMSRSTIPWNALDTIAVALALSGWLIETLADYQMSVFKKDPQNKNKFIRIGLWKWSRHPNYFGEMLFWWGMGFFALNSVYPWGAFLGAFMISYLLVKVTGAPMLESNYSKRPGFEDYLKETNAFLPWQCKG